MEVRPEISYEEYIPTDMYAIQDMYLIRIHQMALIYERIMRGKYRNAVDARALINFYAAASAFYWFARHNIRKHSTKEDAEKLAEIFEKDRRPQKMSEQVLQAQTVYQLIQNFAYRSKLTDLTAKRWKGDFARARKKLGIDTDDT